MSGKAASDVDAIKDTDIVFDCEFCGKSLAIDYRGAGLTIPCSDCGRSVQVPIPDGMDISDLDGSDDEKEIRILNMRKSLASAENRIHQLETEIEELEARREFLERTRTDGMQRIGIMAEKLDAIEAAADLVLKAVRELKSSAGK